MNLLELDHRITFWLYRGDLLSPTGQKILFFIASGVIYILPIILLVLFFRSAADRLASLKIFLSAIVAWFVLNKTIGNFLYNNYHFRDRPFVERGLHELLLERPQKAFPSDHSAVIMAVIFALFYYRYPKLGFFFLIAGVISSLARVVIGFHYFGDIMGGWIVGAVAFAIIYWLDQPITSLYKRVASRWTNQATFHG